MKIAVQLRISKTRYAIVCYVFDNSILNTTNLLPHMSIAFYSNSQGTIRYCNITHLDCFEQSQVYLLQNTTVYELRCFGTPGNPYNSAIIYKDSTSTITLPPTLYDDAQIIDI